MWVSCYVIHTLLSDIVSTAVSVLYFDKKIKLSSSRLQVVICTMIVCRYYGTVNRLFCSILMFSEVVVYQHSSFISKFCCGCFAVWSLSTRTCLLSHNLKYRHFVPPDSIDILSSLHPSTSSVIKFNHVCHLKGQERDIASGITLKRLSPCCHVVKNRSFVHVHDWFTWTRWFGVVTLSSLSL